MKKYIISVLYFISSFILVRDFTAQEKLSLLSLDISVPVVESIGFYYGGTLDSSHMFNSTVSAQKYNLFYSSPIYPKDSIFFQIGLNPMYPGYLITVSFLLDTINNRLNNFEYQYSEESTPSFPETFESISISFTSMDYYTSGDTVFATKSGSQCIRELRSAYHSYNYIQAPNPYFTGKNENTTGIRYEDTSDFKYSVVLLFQKNSSVKELNLPTYFYTSYFTNNISFHFSAINHSQFLFLYDLLGREIKHIEIPSGVSEYSFLQGQLTRGNYLARFGNMNTKFIVY
jgi:hypothetical protein